jgi:hypothetical protein
VRRVAACLATACLASASLASFAAVPARADGRVIAALEWTAPRECASIEHLRQAVSVMLGRPVFGEPADVTAAVVVEREGPRWTVRLATRLPDGRELGVRELRRTGGTCRDLDRSIVLVLSMLIDMPRDELPPPLAPPTPLTLPPIVEPPPRSPAVVEAPWRLRTAVDLVLDVGSLPQATVGTGLDLRVGRSGFGLRAAGRILAPSGGTDAQGRGVDAWLAAGSLGPCVDASLGALELGACAALEAAAIFASARGLEATVATGAQLALSAHVLLSAAVSWRALDVRLLAGAQLALVRPAFVRDAGSTEAAVLFEPAPVGVLTMLSIGVALPESH